MDPFAHSMNRLDVNDASEMALFADSLSIPVERLQEIVAKIGPMRPAIRFFVAKSATERKSSKAAPAVAVELPIAA